MRAIVLVCAALLTSACASPFYDWGRYEDSVFLVAAQPDGFDVDAEIDALSTQIEQTLELDKRVPPGAYAHLGYLYATQGDAVSARSAFESEKALFPESAVFVDGLLARMAGNGGGGGDE